MNGSVMKRVGNNWISCRPGRGSLQVSVQNFYGEGDVPPSRVAPGVEFRLDAYIYCYWKCHQGTISGSERSAEFSTARRRLALSILEYLPSGG